MRVIFGGHWKEEPGWSVLTEGQQDITKRLAFDDASVDAVFTEHVIEHVPFIAAVGFLEECFRILKPGGVIRTVAPMLEALVERPPDDYAESSLNPWFATERFVLKKYGMDLNTDPHVFLLNSMYRLHGHKFIWSAELLARVKNAIGFEATVGLVGVSPAGIALERRVRGSDLRDPESGVVEAVKPT